MTDNNEYDEKFGSYTQVVVRKHDVPKRFSIFGLANNIWYLGPVYSLAGTKDRIPVCCVPVDAKVGEWVTTPEGQDYEIVELDDAIGEESAPWWPKAPCRRARLKRLVTGRRRSL